MRGIMATFTRKRWFCQSDIQIVSCVVTGNAVGQHRRSLQEADAHRSHRKLFCSCLQETPGASVRARLKMFKNWSGVNARGVKTILVVFQICSLPLRCRLVKRGPVRTKGTLRSPCLKPHKVKAYEDFMSTTQIRS